MPPAAPAFAALPLPAPAASLKAKHRDREENSQVPPKFPSAPKEKEETPKGFLFRGMGEEGAAVQRFPKASLWVFNRVL